MGLGLSICRRILEDHGATIEVDSKPGQFTEFTISFPTAYGALAGAAKTVDGAGAASDQARPDTALTSNPD